MRFGRYAMFTAASALFVTWIGYLLALVLTASRPIVLSRPQFSAAADVVEVELPEAHPPEARVIDVLRRSAQDPVGQKNAIRIVNLDDCTGWDGAGEYIVPLSQIESSKAEFRVPGVPRSPGFPADLDGARPRIYRATAAVIEQYHHMSGAAKK